MISVQRSLRCRAFNWDRRLGLGLASVLKRVRSDAVMQTSNKGTPHVFAPEVVKDSKIPMPDPVKEKLRELRNPPTQHRIPLP